MFTTELIKNKEFNILYVKEVNNYLLVDMMYDDKSSTQKRTGDELLDIALRQSEKEYERLKKIIASWEKINENKDSQPSLYTLCLHPVRKCNYECEYCFAERSEYLPSNEITIETAKKAIDFMINDWGKEAKRYVVDIAGSGEPLLRFDFIRELEEYCELKRKEKSKDIKIMFPSNGSLISEENIEYFENNHNILVGVSIDGNEEQNSNRKCKSIGSAFDKTAKGIDLLKNRGVGLAATITHVNENVNEVYDFLYKRFNNADAISLNVVRDFDRKSKTSFYDIDIDNLLKHYEMLLEKVYDNVLNENYNYIRKLMIGTDTLGIYLNRVFSKGVLHKKRCGIVKCLLSVDENGVLYTCSVSNGNRYFKVGDIYEGINKERQEFFKNINVENNNYCKECWAANICSGECLMTSYLTHGNLEEVNKDMCKFRKGLISLIIQFACKLQLNNPIGYNHVLGIVKNRTFFEQVIDSGIWAVQEYIKYKEINVKYSEVLSKIESTDYGTEPRAIMNALSVFCDGIDAYKISNIDEVTKISFPAIAYVNKSKTSYYQYILIYGLE
ncbi:MAG: radical SAM protein, partial [Lachnospiraceae bacterium]|nr:radical SAM protein [Lachnospiraceae bacterium]